MKALKVCPFCGSTATVWRTPNWNYIVECDNDYCGCAYGRNMDLDENTAVKLWNQRVFTSDAGSKD